MNRLSMGPWIFSGLALLLAAACTDVKLCADDVTLSAQGTTVSVGTALAYSNQINPPVCAPRFVTSTLVERPDGSAATLQEEDDLAILVPDLPGRYVIERRLGAQVVRRPLVAIPAGGYQRVLGPVPCGRAAVGANSVLCALVGPKGNPLSARAYRKSDLMPAALLGVAAMGSPIYGGGRYLLPRGTAATVASEDPSGTVTRTAVLSLFGDAPTRAVYSAMNGSRALLATDDGRLRLIDTDLASAPTVTPLRLLTEHWVGGVALGADVAVAVVTPLVPDGTWGLATFDLSDPSAAPHISAGFPDAAVTFVGAQVAAVHEGGLALYAVSPGGDPQLLASNPDAAGYGLASDSARIAVRTAQGVLIVSVADLSPQIFLLDPDAAQVVVEAGRVYVVSRGELQVYDLSR